nr:hypothetical protein [Peptoniphilus harei]
MNLSFIIKSIAYIILEFLYGYKLEKTKLCKRKYFYLFSVLVIILEFIKIKYYKSDFWDRQAIGFLLGYYLYSFIKNLTKKD